MAGAAASAVTAPPHAVATGSTARLALSPADELLSYDRQLAQFARKDDLPT